MSPESAARWLRCRRPLAQPAARLLCLPYAGGGASIFHFWPDGLPGDVEVRAAQLPGRQERLNEPGLTGVAAIVEELAAALQVLPPAPLALYGHSFGALLAFELARRLRATHLAPRVLVIGARRAPQLPGNAVDMHRLSESAFKQELHQRFGTSWAVLRNQDLMELALPPLRADFTALDTYRYVPAAPLDLPLTVLWARQDASMSAQEAAAWRELTSQPTEVHELDAGHLFVDTHRPWVLGHVTKALRTISGPKVP